MFRDELGCTRLLLHSRSLAFEHPVSGQEVTVTAPLDDAFGKIADLFRDTGADPDAGGAGN
jgi:hypothetical protein